MESFNLEDLLQQQQGLREEVDLKDSLKKQQEDRNPNSYHPEDKNILTADKNASLFDFIKMLDKIVTITLKDLQVQFIPDENKIPLKTPDAIIDNPVITYKLIERTPKDAFKPRVMQHIEEKGIDPKETRLGTIYGQKFSSIVQFNIFASVYAVAEEVMERFEDLMFTYAGYFKKNGVGELYFEKQYTDSSYDLFRQQVSIRSIRYKVETEKLITVFREEIQEVETLGLE